MEPTLLNNCPKCGYELDIEQYCFLCSTDLSKPKTWKRLMEQAVEAYLQEECVPETDGIDIFHVIGTPQRMVKAFTEYTRGTKQNPREFLTKQFATGKYDEMVHVYDIKLRSMCAHHLCPIVGKVHFAYIPGEYIVGLSKISRMVDALARRPQVQETLTQQIVSIFQDEVKPLGCGVHIRAYHFCMMHRGVEESSSFTETTALRGNFHENQMTRHEFITSIDRTTTIFP